MTATATEVRSLGLICAPCAVLVANDDASAHDAEAAEVAAAAAAAIRADEGGTLVVDPEAARECELFGCALCGEDCYGAAVPLVIVTEGGPAAAECAACNAEAGEECRPWCVARPEAAE